MKKIAQIVPWSQVDRSNQRYTSKYKKARKYSRCHSKDICTTTHVFGYKSHIEGLNSADSKFQVLSSKKLPIIFLDSDDLCGVHTIQPADSTVGPTIGPTPTVGRTFILLNCFIQPVGRIVELTFTWLNCWCNCWTNYWPDSWMNSCRCGNQNVIPPCVLINRHRRQKWRHLSLFVNDFIG